MRTHLGASAIGDECERKLWYAFRWVTDTSDISGRVRRLLDTGHIEETRMIADLRGIGAEVHDRDPMTGEQFRVFACNGHFSGGMDSVARGLPEGPKTWAVCEFKTHNDKSFKKLLEDGVEKSKPLHYAQMQVYMGLNELTRALYLAKNKNDDDLHSEWIKFDKALFEKLLAKAQRIIDAPTPPARIKEDPAWWQCKQCDHYATCHGTHVAQATCRSCVNSTPVADGKWHCKKWNEAVPKEVQQKGCVEHLFIPPLVPHSEPVDGGEGFVIYKHKDTGRTFINATASFFENTSADKISVQTTIDAVGSFCSKELAGIDSNMIGDAMVTALKSEGISVHKAQLCPRLWFHAESDSYIVAHEQPGPLCSDVTNIDEHYDIARQRDTPKLDDLIPF